MKADSTRGFPRAYRLTKTDEYSSVFGFRRSLHGTFFQLLYKPNARPEPRLGVVVSKKIAKAAVRRNYVKRLCREFFRTHRTLFAGFDVVVRVKKAPTRHDFAAACQELVQLTQRLPRTVTQRA